MEMNAEIDRLFREHEGDERLILTHSVLPVALGTRRAAKTYLSTLDMFKHQKESFANLGIKVIIDADRASELVPRYAKPLYLVKAGDNNFEGEMKAIVFEGNATNIKYGELLGYPKCCTYEFYYDYEADVFPGIRAQEQLKLWREKGRKIDPLAYYTTEFIPCRPDCPEAAAKGEKIRDGFRTAELQEAYVEMSKRRIAVIEADEIEPYENTKMAMGLTSLSDQYRRRENGVIEVIVVEVRKRSG
jgi:hypothetical protein